MPTTVSLDEFRNSAGRELAPSDWFEITQDRVNRFADATEDHQFIHIDPERAEQTPFGGTIAHGFLSLSLLVHLNAQHALVPEGLAMVINYGSDKLRFLAPVPVGSRIRSRQKIEDVTERAPGTWLVKTAVTVDIEHATKPALMAELLMMFVVR
jgi:acyl dehydratase